MVTYCIGSARQKQKYFADMQDAIVLQNSEVLFCASENGFDFFAYGEPPFAAFTVWEYLKYRMALCKNKVTRRDILRFGLSPEKRLDKLCAAKLRIVYYLEKALDASPQTPVVINLDGIRYSRKNAAALNILLSVRRNAYVCVTDNKYVKKSQFVHSVMSFGSAKRRVRPHFYKAKLLAERLGATAVSVM